MKKLTFALLAICMVFSFALTSCKKPDKNVDPKKLKEKIQGKTYVLGTVNKGSTNVTSDFTGFKMVFSGDAGSVAITTGGTSSQTVNASSNVGDNTITLSGTIPSGWASTLTSVSTSNDDGTDLKFNLNITNPKTGAADYAFSLVRQ